MHVTLPSTPGARLRVNSYSTVRRTGEGPEGESEYALLDLIEGKKLRRLKLEHKRPG